MRPDLWILSCAPGYRLAEVTEMFELADPAHTARWVLVTTQPDPVLDFPAGDLLTYPGTDVNISNWWTLGLDHIAGHYDHHGRGIVTWDVLLAESDTRIDRPNLDAVRTEMRRAGCIMAGADWHQHLRPGQSMVRRSNEPWTPDARLPGIGSVIAGEQGLRHDPTFRWWLADDDFEWQHRVRGGTVLVGGTTLTHTGHQGALTGERLTAWEEDQPKFYAKWGGMPHAGGLC